MQRISKPHIVDLLRYFDNNRMFLPRIRYASIRTKPDLIKDLSKYFVARAREGIVKFRLRSLYPFVIPRIIYHLKEQRYYLDGNPVKLPRALEKGPMFSIARRSVTVYFPTKEDWLSREKAAADALTSPEQDMCDPPDELEQTLPC